jgi:hypothetical protein
MLRCLSCKAPYHPATGGIHDAGLAGKVVFCGACERDFVQWIAHHTRTKMRRIKTAGKETVVLRFYDYAYPPKEEICRVKQLRF